MAGAGDRQIKKKRGDRARPSKERPTSLAPGDSWEWWARHAGARPGCSEARYSARCPDESCRTGGWPIAARCYLRGREFRLDDWTGNEPGMAGQLDELTKAIRPKKAGRREAQARPRVNSSRIVIVEFISDGDLTLEGVDSLAITGCAAK